MEIISNKKNPRYPYKVKYKTGRTISIPQQKKFGAYCQAHGCSVTAVSIALQFLGVRQKDGTVWNPQEVADYCKKNLSGYNGSKLAINGTKQAINKISGKKHASWHPIHSRSGGVMRDALDKGHIILFEQKNPIHTIVILGWKNKKQDKVYIASNGKVIVGTIKGQLQNKALHGTQKVENQSTWWTGAAHGSGWIDVYK